MAVVFVSLGLSPREAAAAVSLKGRILLQVQDKGQAWYINPLNNSRYYLGHPEDAYNVMRALGLGVTNVDINKFKTTLAPVRLSGRILLQVQDKGQAFYVSPLNLKLYYLGTATDAFKVMRSLGLGITNTDLAKIKIATVGTGTANSISTITPAPINPIVTTPVTVAPVANATLDTPIIFNFKFKNSSYNINQNFSTALDDQYKNSTKVYTYQGTYDSQTLRNSFSQRP